MDLLKPAPPQAQLSKDAVQYLAKLTALRDLSTPQSAEHCRPESFARSKQLRTSERSRQPRSSARGCCAAAAPQLALPQSPLLASRGPISSWFAGAFGEARNATGRAEARRDRGKQGQPDDCRVRHQRAAEQRVGLDERRRTSCARSPAAPAPGRITGLSRPPNQTLGFPAGQQQWAVAAPLLTGTARPHLEE